MARDTPPHTDPLTEPVTPYPDAQHSAGYAGDDAPSEAAGSEIPVGDIHSHDYGRRLRPRWVFAVAMSLSFLGVVMVTGVISVWVALSPLEWPGLYTGLPIAGVVGAAVAAIVAKQAWPHKHVHAVVRTLAGMSAGIAVLFAYALVAITMGMFIA